MKLYTYFRSSASYRVRIALNLKGIAAEMIPVNLLKSEQREAQYTALNPQGLVPALVIEGQGTGGEGQEILTQSLAIIEYLEEIHPAPPLLPKTPVERARVRAVSLAIACEIAPLNNLRVLKYLVDELQTSEDAKAAWIRHWITTGFTSVEAMLAHSPHTGTYCHGDAPGMADCLLIPQLFNARRFECDLAPYPIIRRIGEACEAHPAFIAAHPSQQKDAI